MEKYHGFENWLKGNNYVSWKSYLSFMKAIEKDLQVDIVNINSVSILKQMLVKLEASRSFMSRSKSDRDNILSGFRTYISFIQEKKKN